MGYECPVCETPQADPRHLADHLAMTAMVRGGPHEAFLDDRVDGWSEMGPAELGDVLVEYATERAYPQVFEDATDHDHAAEPTFEDHVAAAGRRGPGAGRGDAATDRESVLREARELTRRMVDGDREDGGEPESDADDE